jgi:PAS domain S-box-containing protein
MLSAIIQASPLPIVALTRNGDITLWNPAAERVFGWSAAEVMGKPLPFIPAEKLEEHRRMRERDLAGQGFSGLEVRRRKKDGSPIDISVSTAPIRNVAGETAGIMSVYVDITARKAAEDWLQQQAELLEQAYDAVIVFELEGAIQYWNRAAEQLYGYSKAEAIGKISHQLLKTEVVGGGSLLAALRSHRKWSAQLLHTTKDGRRIIVESRQAVVRTAGGVDVVLETNRDVTQRVEAELEMRAVNDALRRANADLEQFAYAAAHDLQEPLRNIAIFAELLTRRYRDLLGGDGIDFMDTIVEGSRRMQALVNDLLRYSRTVRDDLPASVTADSNEVMNQVLGELSRVISETGATVTADPLAPLPLSPTHLSQLLHNLIGNAIKYRRPSVAPRIHIAAGSTETEYLLCVRDNGLGIAPEYRERIFGLFKRLHPATVPGTGLGLAICKRIVDHYGGRIWVEDGPDHDGTAFWIGLPRSAASPGD